MAARPNPPAPFMPIAGAKPECSFSDWRAEFELFILMTETELGKSIGLRLLGQNRAADQNNAAAERQQALNLLGLSESDKICQLFSSLGSEGFRKFRMKTSWTPGNLDGKTLNEALEICDELFSEKMHPFLARTRLYSRWKKPRETFEEFYCDLRGIAKDCQLSNDEDLRISEAMLTGCSDSEFVRKVLDAHPSVVPLKDMLQLAYRHEATKKGSKALTEPPSASGAYAVGYDSGSETAGGYSSDSSTEVLYVKRDGKFKRQTAGTWSKFMNNSKTDRSACGGDKKCSGCNNSGHFFGDASCPAKGKKCDSCNGRNHFAKFCRSKGKKKSNTFKSDQEPRIPIVEIEDDVNCVNDGGKLLCDVVIQPCSTVSPGRQNPKRSIEFWADTGAMVSTQESVFKKNFPTWRMLPTQKVLKGHEGSRTAALGKISVQASFNGGEEKRFTIFIVPDKCLSLLGLHEMGKLKMKIDTESKSIIASTKEESFSEHENLLDDLKSRFPAVFSNRVGLMKNFEHRIQLKPGTVPVQSPMRPVPYTKQERMKEELDKCLEDDIMEPVEEGKSEWNSPLHGVNKPDNSLRITVDFSGTLNPSIIPTIHPVPRPSDIFCKVRNAKFLSKADLLKGYWHLPLAMESRPLTAFLTPSHGLLQFKRLPMGMTDSGASFQRAVEQSLQGLEGIYPYFDDILITGSTIEEHDDRVRKVFERLD